MCLCGPAGLSSVSSPAPHAPSLWPGTSSGGPRGSSFSLREEQIPTWQRTSVRMLGGPRPSHLPPLQIGGEWDQPFHPCPCSSNSSALGLWSSQFIFSGFGAGKQGAPSARGFAHAPDPRDPPPLLSFLGDRAGHLPQGPWEGLTCPSGGFHRDTVAENKKEELKKQRKEEERRESQEITRDQGEAV